MTRSRTTGNARSGVIVTTSSSANVPIRVRHSSRGRPLISALHEPHLPALQFHRTARSGVGLACNRCRMSRTTSPSFTSTLKSCTLPARGVAAPDPHPRVVAHGCSSKISREVGRHDRQGLTRDRHRVCVLGADEVEPRPLVTRPGSRRGCARPGSPAAPARRGRCTPTPAACGAGPARGASRGCTGEPPDRQRLRPHLQLVDPLQRLLDLVGGADDADERVHRLLQVVLDGVGVLAALPGERRQRRGLRLAQRRLGQRGAGLRAACSAEAVPARLPKTSRSDSELPPSRLEPCIPPATSPAANSPATFAPAVSGSTSTPPIT